VNKINSVIIFLIIFILTAVFLRVAGIIDFSGIELLSYLFMISGVAVVYLSLGMDKKGILFTGSTLFLTGILILVSTNFDLEESRLLVFPSVLFILGIGFFMIYLDETSQQLFLIISLFFLAAGILYFLLTRSFAFSVFITSLWSLLKSYWLVLVISLGIILILSRDRYTNTD
jgi:hypothetical protein